jgi:hypothetical protein
MVYAVKNGMMHTLTLWARNQRNVCECSRFSAVTRTLIMSAEGLPHSRQRVSKVAASLQRKAGGIAFFGNRRALFKSRCLTGRITQGCFFTTTLGVTLLAKESTHKGRCTWLPRHLASEMERRAQDGLLRAESFC